MEYLKIKNWEEYQHYSKRNPPWIKFYHSLLDDYEYSRLSDAEKLLLVSLFLLASRTNNQIPNDKDWIKQKSMIKGKINIENLITSGFIKINTDASKVLALDDSNVLFTEEKRRDREETETETDNGRPEWLSKEIFKRFLNHRKSLKFPINKDSYKTFYTKFTTLKEKGFEPEGVVDCMIEKGWRWYKPEWIKEGDYGYQGKDKEHVNSFFSDMAQEDNG